MASFETFVCGSLSLIGKKRFVVLWGEEFFVHFLLPSIVSLYVDNSYKDISL